MSPITMKVAAIAVLLALVVGFGQGWLVNGWRLGTQIAELKGKVSTQDQSIRTLEGANQRCTAGVADVKESWRTFADAQAKRDAAAAAAVQAAAKAAEGHIAAARDAMNRPPPKAGEECKDAAREASDYAKRRKAAP